MKRIGGLVGAAILAFCSTARADEYYTAGPEMFAAGSVLMTLVTPTGLAGIILFTEPRGQRALGAGLMAGAGAMLSVGLPLFLLGGRKTNDPPIVGVGAVMVGAGRVDLKVAF